MPLPIPQIAVLPAPAELDFPIAEHMQVEPELKERPSLLPVPPRFPGQFYRPRLSTVAPRGVGLDNERFETLLQSSRDRSALRKQTDLRKEVALKVHKSKQEERRARFLAKIGAPPSPTAIDLPATPPESPALFHFTLPSPGLISPLALFESLSCDQPPSNHYVQDSSWVEQVEFRCPKASSQLPPLHSIAHRNLGQRRHSLPSLEEISSHFNLTQGPTGSRPRGPLPAFLTSQRIEAPAKVERHADSVVGESAKFAPTFTVKTFVMPRSRSTSPVALTEANLLAFEQRNRASKGLIALKRRVSAEGVAQEDDRRLRRFSAPPALPIRECANHLEGGF